MCVRVCVCVCVQGPTLVLGTADKVDAGNYFCRARNSLDTKDTPLIITVEGTICFPLPFSVQLDPLDLLARVLLALLDLLSVTVVLLLPPPPLSLPFLLRFFFFSSFFFSPSSFSLLLFLLILLLFFFLSSSLFFIFVFSSVVLILVILVSVVLALFLSFRPCPSLCLCMSPPFFLSFLYVHPLIGRSLISSHFFGHQCMSFVGCSAQASVQAPS